MNADDFHAGVVLDVIVIGAGISGLTAAYALRDKQILVLEADPTPGGRCRRIAVEGVRMTAGAEGWYDPGPDSPERQLVEALGIKLHPVKGRASIWTDGALQDPSSLEELMSVLPLQGEDATQFAETWERVNAAWLQLADPDTAVDLIPALAGMSARDWLGELRPEVSGAFSRLIACEFGAPLDLISSLHFVTSAPAFAGASFSAWSEFEVPDGGGPDITEALADKLGEALVTGAVVLSVEPDGAEYVVRFLHDGQVRSARARHIVMATPPGATAALIPSLPNWKLDALETVGTYPVFEVNLLVRDDGTGPWRDQAASWTFADAAFSMFLHSKADIAARDRDHVTSLRLFSCGRWAAPFLDVTDDGAVVAAFTADLRRLFGDVNIDVVGGKLVRWHEGVTMPRPGYAERLDDLLRPVGGMSFAGDYAGFLPDGAAGCGDGSVWGEYFGTVTLHTAMRSGLRAAREARSALS